MRIQGKRSFSVALVLGLIAALGAYMSIELRAKDARAGWELVRVGVAAQDLKEGTVMTEDMIVSKMIPSQFVTTSVVTPEDYPYILNQRLLAPVNKNDPFLLSQFESARGTERLSAKVQKRARAFTVDTSKAGSVGGWVRPNDHVDVIGTFRDPQTSDPISVTLLENVVVLATGKLTGSSPALAASDTSREYGHVTLLVVPEEAEILALAADLGKVALSLRNEEDLDTLTERGRADPRTLLSGLRTKALQERRLQTVQIIQGSTSRLETGPLSPAEPSP